MPEPTSPGEELQGLCDELVVKLEDAAVPSVGINLELAVRQSLGEVDRVGRRHHAVVIAVCDEDRLLDGGQIGRLLRNGYHRLFEIWSGQIQVV